jgi:carboxylesterase type B
MFPTFSEAVLLIVPFASAVSSTTAYAQPTATINAGVVVGTATSVPSSTNTVNKFLGIPFAAPPIRFAPPVPPKPWTEPFQANKNAPSCIQQFPNELIESLVNNPPPEAGESEDCLYINVYAPAAPAPKEGRTVMFWLYGGDLLCGHNSWPFYDGSSFAAHQDVIIVAPNYRTNGK